ncbi:Outer membrane protein assembly factor BamB, contains PQQ-like beta-propeller repeat [Geodermatophilus amargosae]|uniref:Outer membrane protein assembly factor BamB, contains PQQ-like beta-propeller repeat n=1 Tax=Geodermatophilus amargosae TaxID=1296565 RepID=A0A1I6XT99_9ACTN|nr:PQQ-binding-like beta-propeller repeat protein [Geodermatophilus amargosae]SFT41755.1 Outer membrane protein assembly factor BamB, contains PQQ-like beta-propeller repeat [Geodermatophilus amargosae]
MALRPPPLRVWVWTAATLALVVVATLLWRGSSVAATDSTTAPAPEALPGTPSGDLAQAWSVDTGVPLPPGVVEGGRVVVPSADGVTALDPATGEEAWHYRRADAALCGLSASNGLVVAVFRAGDRCDEALALTATTGVRAWTRNLSLRGDATIAGTDQVVLASSDTGIVVIDPVGDNVRWRSAAEPGCALVDTAVGSAGVAVLQRCDGTAAVQLRLFDSFSGQARWTRDLTVADGSDVRLAGVDRLVDVVAGDALLVHRPDDGAQLQELALPAATDGGAEGDPVLQGGVGDVALVWARGTLSALDGTTGAQLWQVPALGLPTASAVGKGEVGRAGVWVPESGSLVLRDPATGAETARVAVEDALEPGGRAAVVGPVLVYALPDRVAGWS